MNPLASPALVDLKLPILENIQLSNVLVSH